MVDRYVLDAFPLVAFLNGEAGAPAVARFLGEALAGDVGLSLTTVNAGEVILSQERDWGAEAGHRTLATLQDWPIELITVDLELAARAAWFKLRGRISYADCFAAALAHRDGLPLITGDPEFRRVEDLIRIAWLDELTA